MTTKPSAIINKAIKTTGVITNSTSRLYIKGGNFNLISNGQNEIKGLLYKAPNENEFITLPCFMGIKPTYYVKDKDSVLQIVFLIGTEPCNLHRLIFSLDYCNSNAPTFDFIEDPIFEQCQCDDEDNEDKKAYPVVIMARLRAPAGGRGNGTWGP